MTRGVRTRVGHAHPHHHHAHGARSGHGVPPEGGEGGGHHRDGHGNPSDLEGYLERLEGEDRAAWQEPDRVVAALALRPGAVACDVGAGPGYFALRLARAVGPRGAVYAIDVEPRMIVELQERMRRQLVENVRPMLARAGRPGLPPRRCDLILIVNAFHHFPAGAAYLRRLAARLAPGGRLVNIDFHRREMPVGPPLEHKVDRSDFLAAAEKAGLRIVREHRFLRYHYFLELAPAGEVGGPTARRGGRAGGGPGRARPSPPPRRGGRRPAARSTSSRRRPRRSSRRRGRSPAGAPARARP